VVTPKWGGQVKENKPTQKERNREDGAVIEKKKSPFGRTKKKTLGGSREMGENEKKVVEKKIKGVPPIWNEKGKAGGYGSLLPKTGKTASQGKEEPASFRRSLPAGNLEELGKLCLGARGHEAREHNRGGWPAAHKNQGEEGEN